MPLQSTNPATGDVMRTFPALDDDALQQRIALCADAAAAQRALPLEHRVLCLRKMASLMEEDRGELARLVTLETGKPIRFSIAEVTRCADLCRYYADSAVRLLAPELLQSEAGQTYVQWSPMGVILAVMPWESPLWQALRFAVPTLVAGNAVLLKHAASVPQVALQLEALARRAGFPRGALLALLVEDRAVETVFADDRVAAVTVSGSEPAGRALAAQAGWLLKKVAMHLPANDALIVTESADLEAAVAAAVRALQESGSVRRIILDTGVYTEFLRRFTPLVDSFRIGDPTREETEIGPVGTPEAAALLQEQMTAAVAAGGRVLAGGARLVGRGNFLEPTILADVPRTAPVARDPLTGPVCMVFRARDTQDAIRIANGSAYMRAVSVWTQEPAEQQQLIAGVDAGFVALNALPMDDARLPVGGGRRAGYGRELGSQGIREFLVAKTVTLGQ